MKKIIFSMMMVASVAYAELPPVLSINEIDSHVMEQMLAHEGVIVEFPVGTELPVGKVEVDGDLFAMKVTDGSWRAKQTFYVWVSREDLKFSVDGSDWQPFSEFTTGNFGVHLCDGLDFVGHFFKR